jgi:signal transduction histidine kinase
MTSILSNEELNQQIRNVSHEIRNHLSICDMYSQIIKKNLEKYEIHNSSIENAIECIQQSIKIIGTNLLELKSLNQNNPQILDFEKIVKTGAEMSKAYICDKNIEFEVYVKNTALINADETKLLSCITNIIKNGIEAIEIKGKISVLAEIKEDKGIIKITNDGKPIPKDKQETIFEQGYTTKKTGSGLGLAICKRYLGEQNITLELAKSTKTQTTFEIKIPITK